MKKTCFQRYLFLSNHSFKETVDLGYLRIPDNSVLYDFGIPGPRKAREAQKHFGKAPGVPGSNTK